MFKDMYSKDNEQIVPDEATKRYIKSKLIEEDRKSKKKINLNAIIATALSLVLAVGVTFIAKNPAPQNNYIGDAALLENMTYDGIYESINSRISKDNNFFGYVTDGIAFLTGSLARDDVGTAQPESSNSGADLGEGTTGTGDPGESSTTNNQVQGVDEADLVKNDGKYIYSVKDGNLIVTDSNDGDPKVVTKKGLTDKGETVCGLFVNGDRMAVLLNSYRYGDIYIRLLVLDITDKENINVLSDKKQDGYYTNSRMIDGTVYMLSNHSVRNNDIAKSKPETYVPCVDGVTLPADNICVIEEFETPSYLVISSVDLVSGEIVDNTAILGGAENVYCNSEHLYYTFSKYGKFETDNQVEYKTETTIVKLSLEKRKIKTVATGKVEGRLLNQFSMDEYDGNLRVVTTHDRAVTSRQPSYFNGVVSGTSKNALYVLDKDLKQIGAIENLAEGERVYSVRFDGEIGYFVTFRQVDPLFTVDLSNPREPKILSELKIPGFSEYLHPYGEGRLFGFGKSATEQGSVTGLKISMFDVSDPSNVTELHLSSVPAEWSEASEDHKAIMVDHNKNIIAFLAADNYAKTRLFVYGYSEGNGFFKRAESFVDDSYHFGTRFVWINDHFYLVSQKGITTFSLETFEKLTFLAY